MTNNCGIYKITNTINGDFYIGSSYHLKRRLYEHRQALVKNTHYNRHLQRAWNKYGADNFEFTAILLCTIEYKLYFEQILLDLLKPVYNIAICATANMQGRNHTKDTRKRMSEVKIGERPTEETKRKISGENHHNFGIHLSEETKSKISEAKKGKRKSEETRHNMSEAKKRYFAEKKAKANLIHDTGLFDTTIYNLDIQKKGSTMTFDDFDHIDSMLDNIERAWEEQSAKETIK